MSETTRIKKGNGIEGVIRDITPGRIEDVRKLEVTMERVVLETY